MPFLKNSDFSIIALTETWIFQDDADIFALFHNVGYTLLLSTRLLSRGSAVGFLVQTSLPLLCISISHNLSYSYCLAILFTLKDKSISINVIYRPPKTEFASFLIEFNDLSIYHISSPIYYTIILGDFNYHFNATSNQHIMFTNLTNSLSLSQHVNFPTNINCNIIDLVFSSSLHSELMVSNISRLDLLSDHFLISFKTNFTITPNQKTRITYRPITNINSMIFLAELHSALSDYCYSPVVFNSILFHLLDKHAHSKTISVTLHHDTQWFTSHLMSLKRSLRKSERIYISLKY